MKKRIYCRLCWRQLGDAAQLPDLAAAVAAHRKQVLHDLSVVAVSGLSGPGDCAGDIRFGDEYERARKRNEDRYPTFNLSDTDFLEIR
jgi:hypothetical protein